MSPEARAVVNMQLSQIPSDQVLFQNLEERKVAKTTCQPWGDQ
ncbi:18805_t:CDS:2 [Gigaspora rosea]|nr:18805_t:CDS:2 [Gigaspora rosea]